MPTLTIPTPVAIDLGTKTAFADELDGVKLEDSASYADDKHYEATCTLSGADFDFTGWSFKFSCGTSVATDATPIAETDSADFDTSGAASGVLKWPVDMLTAEYATLVGDLTGVAAFQTGLVNLWGLPPGGTDWQLLARWPIKFYGSVGITTTPPTPGSGLATLGDLGSRIESGIVLTIDGDGRAVVTVNGTERGRI